MSIREPFTSANMMTGNRRYRDLDVSYIYSKNSAYSDEDIDRAVATLLQRLTTKP